MNKIAIPIIIAAFVLCGCAPEYISNDPNTVMESLPMTQADTASKLNKICNDVVTSSATLEQQMTKYLSHIVDSKVEDKKAIQSSVLANLEVVKDNIAEVSSFNPAEALSERTSEIRLELSNTETYLRSLDEAVKKDDVENMRELFQFYINSVSHLKTLSMGM